MNETSWIFRRFSQSSMAVNTIASIAAALIQNMLCEASRSFSIARSRCDAAPPRRWRDSGSWYVSRLVSMLAPGSYGSRSVLSRGQDLILCVDVRDRSMVH